MPKKIDYVSMTDQEILKLIDGEVSLDQLKDISKQIGLNASAQAAIDDAVKNLYKIAIKAAKGMA